MSQPNTSALPASAPPGRSEPWKLTKYRPDIDGLRAIAILAVVAFHVSPSWIRGGFIGVDIFFVISGFLISSVILENLDAGRFRFRDFYARRIRRIFPALIVIMIATLAFGWIAMLADEYRELGKHITAAAAFAANFIFWKESGYFDHSATKPLLHLWSLGVEEQYYLVWPLVLWAGWKRRLNLMAVVSAIAAASFLVNLAVARESSAAAFYLPHTRFWELLIGSGLACAALRTPQGVALLSRLQANSASFAGLALIAAGLVSINGDRAFPGWWALLPALGAALIIFAGPDAWLNRVALSHPAMVLCGLISYPLYLWHWPILAFLRVIRSEEPPLLVRIEVALLSFVLAWITYKVVERPLRFGSYAKAATAGLVLTMVLLGSAGLVAFRREGFPSRSAAAVTVVHPGDDGHSVFNSYAVAHYFACTPESIRKDALSFDDAPRCLQSKKNTPVDVALIGDSHAEALFVGLAEQFPQENIAYYIKTTLPVKSDPDFRTIFDYLLSDHNVKTVILSAVWSKKASEVPAGSTLQSELSATAETLGGAGKAVLLVEDVPFFPFDARACKYSRRFSAARCDEDTAFFDSQRADYPALQAVAQAHRNVQVLNTAKYFCNSRVCSMADAAGNLLYRDDNHINLNGTRYLASKIAEQIGPSLLFN